MQGKKGRRFLSLFLFIFILSASAFADTSDIEFYPAGVRDISDRAYENAVLDLIDGAQSSIVMSMYIIMAEESGPVGLLLARLEKALDRGVKVEMYLNTRPSHGIPGNADIDKRFGALIKKGARIYKFTPNYLLHDKLMVVDERFVVSGSTNWSTAALKSNYESTDLIDSPQLAKAKLLRMRRFPLEGQEKDAGPRPDRPKALEPLAKDAVVNVSAALLDNKDYFPRMLRSSADRDMNMYLLLLAKSAGTGEREFFVPLEDLAVTLGVDPGWTDTAMRRQMIKDLRALRDKYKLIEVDFSYGKDAWVELKALPGRTFTVSGDFFGRKNLDSKSQPAKVVFLIERLLEAEGKSIDSVGVRAAAARFGVSEFSIRKGMRELK